MCISRACARSWSPTRRSRATCRPCVAWATALNAKPAQQPAGGGGPRRGPGRLRVRLLATHLLATLAGVAVCLLVADWVAPEVTQALRATANGMFLVAMAAGAGVLVLA